MLLVIENDTSFCKYLHCPNSFLDVSDLSIITTLEKLMCYTEITLIYFPVEIKLKNSSRQSLCGIDLLKHIRLSPELGSLQFSPIILGYTYPSEVLLNQPDNAILCSPGIQLFNLKNIHHLNEMLSKRPQTDKIIAKNDVKPYILITETDIASNEHDVRNVAGPTKLQKELAAANVSSLSLALWQKKLAFLRPDNSLASDPTTVSDEKFYKSIRGKRILYLDDEAEKWQKVLKILFKGASVDVKSNIKEISAYFEKILNAQKQKLQEYSSIDNVAQTEFEKDSNGKEFKTAITKINNLKSQLFGSFTYDLILLDMRLDKKSDQAKTTENISGLALLKTIMQINPFIPVIMFTASNKIGTYQKAIEIGAKGFWIKNISSANELKKMCFCQLESELPGKRSNQYLRKFYYKLLLTKFKDKIYCYSYDKSYYLYFELLNSGNRNIIYECYPTFIDTIKKIVDNTFSDLDVAVLWRVTGIAIEKRLPILYCNQIKGDKYKFKKVSDQIPKESIEKSYRRARNYFIHGDEDKDRDSYYSPQYILNYIEHTIDFLLDYR